MKLRASVRDAHAGRPALTSSAMNESVSIRDALAAATRALGSRSDSPRLDAEILLARAIDVPRSYLFAHPEDRLDEAAETRLRQMLARRRAGEPMAYITGFKEFWSLELFVSPATLVPRPETELLVDLALREIPRSAAWQVLDLGTGCGAIAVAIANERPLCELTAIDIDPAALAIARQNVRQLNLCNVTCLDGDWTAPVRGRRFNVIVSNPPYVRADDAALATLVAEPYTALVAGSDGLDAIRALARDCGELLAADGIMLVEHGACQKDDVAAILTSNDWSSICCHDDFAGRPRVTTARRAN